jgi:excisionase family DNA binding protein
MPPTAEDRLLTAEQVAELLQVSVQTVYRLVNAGRLQHQLIGVRQHRFRRAWVEAFIDGRSPASDPRKRVK